MLQEKKEREKGLSGSRASHESSGESPYEAISATLGWESFRLVHSTWLTAIDLPTRDENKWDMQVRLSRHLKETCCDISP